MMSEEGFYFIIQVFEHDVSESIIQTKLLIWNSLTVCLCSVYPYSNQTCDKPTYSKLPCLSMRKCEHDHFAAHTSRFLGKKGPCLRDDMPA